MSTERRVELVLIEAAIRLLNHKLRTPLSVISNELFCLQDGAHAEEIARAQRKIGEISDILREATVLAGRGSEKSKVNVTELWGVTGSIPAVVNGDPEELRRLWEALDDMIRPYTGESSAGHGGPSGSSDPAGEAEVRLSRSYPSARSVTPGRWESGVAFAEAQGAADSFSPLVVDCAVIRHAGRLEITASPVAIDCHIYMPKAE